MLDASSEPLDAGQTDAGREEAPPNLLGRSRTGSFAALTPKTGALTGAATKSGTLPASDTRMSVAETTTPASSIKVSTRSLTSQTSISLARFSSLRTSTKSLFYRSRTTPITPALPGLAMPRSGFRGLGAGYLPRVSGLGDYPRFVDGFGRARRAYTPSAYVLSFGIRGKKPGKRALKTGLVLRPILS